MSYNLYIVYRIEEGGCGGCEKEVIHRIFNSCDEVDKFMLSQTWASRGYSSKMSLPYTAYKICIDIDGIILSNEEVDYSEHAPPGPKDQGKAKSYAEYMKTKFTLE